MNVILTAGTQLSVIPRAPVVGFPIYMTLTIRVRAPAWRLLHTVVALQSGHVPYPFAGQAPVLLTSREAATFEPTFEPGLHFLAIEFARLTYSHTHGAHTHTHTEYNCIRDWNFLKAAASNLQLVASDPEPQQMIYM